MGIAFFNLLIQKKVDLIIEAHDNAYERSKQLALNGGTCPKIGTDGDGYAVSPHCRLILTPGHTAEDLTLLVETEGGTVACTHAWWRADRTPEIDPLADDQAVLEASRRRILELADQVVPAHGAAFEVPRRRRSG